MNIDKLVNEIIDPDGMTTVLTTNILRYWSRAKITVFAKHLLGDECQKCIRKETRGDV